MSHLTPEQEAASTASSERLQELVNQNGARILKKAACNGAISRKRRLHIITNRCLTEFLTNVKNWQPVTFSVTDFYEYDDENYSDDSKSPYRSSDSVSITYSKFQLKGTEDEENEIYKKLRHRLSRNTDGFFRGDYIGSENNKYVANLCDIIISFFIFLIEAIVLFRGGIFLISSIKHLFASFDSFIAISELLTMAVFVVMAFIGWILIFVFTLGWIERLYKQLVLPSIFLFIKSVAIILNLARLVLLIIVN